MGMLVTLFENGGFEILGAVKVLGDILDPFPLLLGDFCFLALLDHLLNSFYNYLRLLISGLDQMLKYFHAFLFVNLLNNLRSMKLNEHK
jgi:hypothetical protein